MLGNFFNMDNAFWRWVSRISDMIFLSLLFYLCCIPVVTIIPACCALFDSVSRCVKPDMPGCYARFFKTFWKELKRGIPLSIIWLIIGIIVALGDQILVYNGQLNEAIGTYSILYRIMMIAMFSLLLWVVPLQSRYHLSFLELHRNALYFCVARLPGTIWLLISTVLAVGICFIHIYTFLLLLIVPALIALAHTSTIEKAFQLAFPEDYVEGQLVTSAEEREAALKIAEEKKK